MTVWLRKASLQRVASDSWHHRAEAAAQWQAGSGHRLVDFWKEQEVRTSKRLGFQDPDVHRLDESFFFLAAFSLFTTLINCYKWCLIHVKKKNLLFLASTQSKWSQRTQDRSENTTIQLPQSEKNDWLPIYKVECIKTLLTFSRLGAELRAPAPLVLHARLWRHLHIHI